MDNTQLLEAILAELVKINDRADAQAAQAAKYKNKADSLMEKALNTLGGKKHGN